MSIYAKIFHLDGGGSHSLGKVSHLLHASFHGQTLKWVRLELCCEFPENEGTSSKAYTRQFYAPGGIIDQIALGTDNEVKSRVLVLRNLDDGGRDGGRPLIAYAPHAYARQYSAGHWRRGVAVSFLFSAAEAATPQLAVAYGGDNQASAGGPDGGTVELFHEPQLVTGTLNSSTCKHGERLAVAGGETGPAVEDAEYLHDYEDFDYGRLVRYEKQSTQKNSLLRWALAHEGLGRSAGAGVTTVRVWSPTNPKTPAGRADGGVTPENIPVSIGNAAGATDFDRLHVMEASGIFKHLRLPSLAELDPASGGLDHPFFTSSGYLRQQLDEVLEEPPAGKGGDDIPHEFVTIVRP